MNDKNQNREDMNCVDKFNSDQRTDQGVTAAPEPIKNVLAALRDVGVTFVAVPEEHLAEGYCTVLCYFPIGTDDESLESALETLDKCSKVTIGEETFVFELHDVLHTDIHSHRQIVLFNHTNAYGLNEISVNEGIENVREFVENNSEPTPVPSDTVDAENLIQELADAGAVAIAVEPMLSDEDRLMLKAWIPPATGYDTVGSYEEVKIGDEFFDLQWEFVWDCGPDFFNRVPLCASGDIIGMDKIAVSEGISNIEAYIADGCPRSVTAYSPGGEV